MPLPDEVVADIDERVRLAVAGGYDDDDEIVDALVELVEYDPDTEDLFAADSDAITAAIRQVVATHAARHREAEAAFDPTTDCDRLTAAFAQLEVGGIVMGEDYGFTMSDLREDMWERIDQVNAADGNPRGWAGFHRQDLDRVVDTGVLCIAFAALTDSDEDFRAIGTEVAAALAAAGFTVDWDGDPNRRIELTGLRWHKRR